jgi:alpha-1,2-mannosyltransferase
MSYKSLGPARLNRITLALGLGFLSGFILYLLAGNRPESAFFRGDFPAFYAAAEIIWTGRGAELYDFALQAALENQHWPDFAGGYYLFPYPPFFALLLAPLAALPPLLAKALASGVLFAAFLGALLLARGSSAFVRQHFAFSCCYLLTFAPLQIAIVGVQNTALSLLCLALVYWARHTGRPWVTGLGAALLLYKPQFGVLLFFFLLGRGRREELRGWALGALLLYLLGIPVLGPTWPLVWFQAATQFGDLNFTSNGHNMISLAGLIYWGGEIFLGSGARVLPWAYLLSAGLLLPAVGYVRRDEQRFVLVPSLVLLLSPQTLFYDVAIALFFLVQDLRPGHPRDFLMLAAIWLYGILALMLRDLVTFPLFSLLLLAILWLQVPGAFGPRGSAPEHGPGRVSVITLIADP